MFLENYWNCDFPGKFLEYSWNLNPPCLGGAVGRVGLVIERSLVWLLAGHYQVN